MRLLFVLVAALASFVIVNAAPCDSTAAPNVDNLFICDFVNVTNINQTGVNTYIGIPLPHLTLYNWGIIFPNGGAAGNLMSNQQSPSAALWFTISTDASWTPNDGVVSIPIILYTDQTRTTIVGMGTFTSTNFYAKISSAGVQNVTYFGGELTLAYTIFNSNYFKSASGGTHYWPVNGNGQGSMTFTFTQSNNMIGIFGGPTVTDRIFTVDEATAYNSNPAYLKNRVFPTSSSGAPLFDYSYVAIGWGSTCYDYSSKKYCAAGGNAGCCSSCSANFGLDLGLALTCSTAGGTKHNSPPPPMCPGNCASSIQASVSGNCGKTHVSATTNAAALTLTLDKTLDCSGSNIHVGP